MRRTKPKTTAAPTEPPQSSQGNSDATTPSSRRPPKVSAAALRKLRQTARTVRTQVAQDCQQIAEERGDVIADAVAQGKLTKLTVLLRRDEQAVLQAIDAYATAHGLTSRN